mmetsp:Transcript_13120/g.23118  ORF Transcript_13120/g.23118 Transcript_13120/m.23118 type:complete len:110 (-) Transcript_13120:444-773(-)
MSVTSPSYARQASSYVATCTCQYTATPAACFAQAQQATVFVWNAPFSSFYNSTATDTATGALVFALTDCTKAKCTHRQALPRTWNKSIQSAAMCFGPSTSNVTPYTFKQ